ncbi:uncharacterized protein K460DRAFT_206851 [Cucurbitaria berberidis CBS 394.84]|uniref:Zn(2)-C6 fungal-type domain-containing protein n=1 Tax=Cucurbitaria berberidis CBS 394.84 TaxID=1168544 RepID=A0A9P4G7I2_9PLEO|nr:uncharacterized protein K460DRAFT_206851 [Cucurbitaria berberidis CBS 394.84]KAF1840357.1 hypothetical protein K460DRAFT_206851 [Cucurbitaria berberidis CBS 394.84]
MWRDSASLVVWSPFAAEERARHFFIPPVLASHPMSAFSLYLSAKCPRLIGHCDCIAPSMEASNEDRRDETDGAHASKKRKRGRQAKSCVACHRRKQKCDGELPCFNCRRRNVAASCMYTVII